MPYHLEGKCVVKDNGERVKCHPTRSKAMRHMRALYANVPDVTKKDLNFGATVGQTIGGNLARVEGGRFGSGGAGASIPGQQQNIKRPATGSIQQRIAFRLRNRIQTLERAGLDPSEAAAIVEMLKGPVTELRAANLIKMGLAHQSKDGTYRLTTLGRVAARLAVKGDVEGVKKAMELAAFKYEEREAAKKRSEERKKRAAALAELRRRQRQARDVGREMENRTGKSQFAVFKQANGKLRWISVSSNPYKDRDGEYVTLKSLQKAVALGDLTGIRGTFRWWHVDGVDFGPCDFQAMHGKFLVESGTFFDERTGRYIAEKADNLEISIAFVHPDTEPDYEKAYHNIGIFERSAVPRGLASNTLTQLAVKGYNMDAKKLQALRALVNGDDELLSTLLGTISQKEAGADSSGLTFKSEDGTAPQSSSPTNTYNFFATAPAQAPDPAPAPQSSGEGTEFWTDAEVKQLAGHLVPLMMPVLAQEVGKHTTAVMKEFAQQLGAFMEPLVRQKSADSVATKEAHDAQAAKIVQLEQRLKELEGDQPVSFFRASENPATLANAATRKELNGPTPDDADPLADIMKGLGFTNGMNAR